jgi:serine/threonine protein kinase
MGEEGDVTWVAMEVAEGCTLAEVLSELHTSGRERTAAAVAEAVRQISRRKASRNGDAAAREVFAGSWVQGCVRIVRDVARALDHAHRAGIVHRDVNPSNVLIDAHGRVRLVDFGLATARGKPKGESSSLPYLAPEQLRGDEAALDARTDVYGLGVTLYELLSLELPYHDPDPARARALALEGDPLPVHDLVPGIPWDVETVCLAAMERDRSRRYANAEAFARDLENILAARPVEARRPGPALRLRRWVGRHRMLALGVAMALGLAFAAPVLAWLDARAEADRLHAATRLLQQQLDRANAELDALRAGAPPR